MTPDQPRTLLQKIYDGHRVADHPDGGILLYVDLHLVTDITSPQAFEGLRARGIGVHRPGRTLAVADHNIPTSLDRIRWIVDPENRAMVEAMEANAREFGVPYVPLDAPELGIVHIIGPELGLTLPGSTIVCGDSHTATHGAFGALAFGIGTSEVEHVLATQTLVHVPSRTMQVQIDGELGPGVTAKDVILSLIARIGTSGGTGHIIEYSGSTISRLDMAGRMTICNMSIEAGARAGLIAPDETTFAYLKERRFAPQGEAFDRSVERWRSLRSDPGATFDRKIELDASEVEPSVTWGTTPETAIPVGGRIPDPADEPDPGRRAQMERMLAYMDLAPGRPIKGQEIHVVFIGSCTNSRIEDLRAAAAIARGHRRADGVRALVVPGSGLVKAQAESEGLDRIFRDAGFEWREAGCSMCVGLNEDRLAPGQRSASTSNRNFEGRQGAGGRTHLMSPAMAAAAAIAGRIVDVRELA